MKENIYKVLNFAIKLLTFAFMLVSAFGLVVGYIPEEQSVQILEWLNASRENVMWGSVAGFVGAVSGYGGLTAIKWFDLKLMGERLARSKWEATQRHEIDDIKGSVNKVEELVIKRLKAVETRQNEHIKANTVFNRATALKQLSLSDSLVPKEVKDLYKEYLELTKGE